MNTFWENTAIELGFSGIEDFIQKKMVEELDKKISRLEAEVLQLEKKYGMSFLEFQAKYLTPDSEEDFDKEDDGAEWEWNLSAIEKLKTKLESLKVARSN